MFLGYAIAEEDILITDIDRMTAGSFVNIVRKGHKLRIMQGAFGAWLFLFKDDDYWAISNSFLYLANYLKNKVKLSFNNEYAFAYFSSNTAPMILNKTLINEIQYLLPNIILYIDLDSRELLLHEVHMHERSIGLDSSEGIELLDRWHKKYNSLIDNLLNSYIVQFDLSGGFDSRCELSALRKPDIKQTDNLLLFSLTDKEYTHTEDFEIASKIASTLGLQLNTIVDDDSHFMDSKTSALITMYTKGGFNCHFNFQKKFYNHPKFHIHGLGGEQMRAFKYNPPHALSKIYERFRWWDSYENNRYARKLYNESLKICRSSIAYSGNSDIDLTVFSRWRLSGQLSNFEAFLANIISISPLYDPMLMPIRLSTTSCPDDNLLFAIIFSRFLPEISDIYFNNHQNIDKETLKIAKQINDAYPYSKSANSETYKIICRRGGITPSYTDNNKTDPLDYLFSIFISPECRSCIINTLGELPYRFAMRTYEARKHNYYQYIVRAVSIYIAHEICFMSSQLSSDLFHLFPHNDYMNKGLYDTLLRIPLTARVDISICGSNESTVSLGSSNDIYIKETWNIPESDLIPCPGLALESSCGHLEAMVKVSGNGLLYFTFRAPFIRDEEDKCLPLKIDFTKIVVETADGETLYKLDTLTVCNIFDNVISFNIPVAEKASYKIQADWKMHKYPFPELRSLLDRIYQSYANQDK